MPATNTLNICLTGIGLVGVIILKLSGWIEYLPRFPFSTDGS